MFEGSWIGSLLVWLTTANWSINGAANLLSFPERNKPVTLYCIIAPITSTASVILKRFLDFELQFHDSAHSTCQSSWAFLFDGAIRLQRRDKLCHGGWNIQRVHAKQHLGAANDGGYQMIHNQNFSIGFASTRSEMRCILYPPHHCLQSLYCIISSITPTAIVSPPRRRTNRPSALQS